VWAMPTALLVGFGELALGDSAVARRSFSTARDSLVRAVAATPDDPRLHSSLGLACAGLGRRDEAVREGLRGVELLPIGRDAFYGVAPLYDLSVIYALTGETDAALSTLERLLALPTWVSPTFVRMVPLYRPLAGDPRFEKLLRARPAETTAARRSGPG